MRLTLALLTGSVLGGLAAGLAYADSWTVPSCNQNCPVPMPSPYVRPVPAPAPSTTTPSTTTPSTTPSTDASTAPQTTPTDPGLGAGAAQQPAGSEAGANPTPQMLGYQLGPWIRTSPLLRPSSSEFSSSSFSSSSSSSSSNRVLAASRGGSAIAIADNESPAPTDRVFLNYDYFNDIHASGVGVGRGDLHREIFGLEKTILDGDASVGIRLPVYQTNGAGFGDPNGFGDLTVIGKYALLKDCDTGSLLSAGLALTAPTGRTIRLADNTRLNDVLFQPFVGFIWATEEWYVHGFSSIIIPTEARDVTFMSNDVGLGYRMYSDCDGDGMITGIIPTIEMHLATPYNHNGLNSAGLVAFPEGYFAITGGVHLDLWNRARLTLGASTPLSGPRLYDVEGIAQFNLRF